MIYDLETVQPAASDVADVYDVCLVGAGAAGIVLALELLKQGRRVVLLEGGGAEIEERSQETYRSEVVGNTHRGIHTGRFRAKGGTTNRWGGQILEFEPHDFERRAGIAESGWPFAKTTLEPFYERALKLEGLGGVTRNDDDVWVEAGLKPPLFHGLEAYFSRWCPEPAFARVHREVLEKDPKLALWLHANAVDMIFDGEQMTGVRCRTLGGTETVFRARVFAFCLGAIESTRFFLQPRPGGLPWNVSGLLGKHFQDHIDGNAAEVKPLDSLRFHKVFDNIFTRGYKYHPKLRLSAALQAERGTLNVAGTMYFLSDSDGALARLKETAKRVLRGRLREVSGSDIVFTMRHLPLLLRQTIRYKLKHRAYNPPGATIMLRVHCEQEPSSSSSITLAEERDSFGLLRTRLDWRISDRELTTIREYVIAARDALAGIAEVIPDPDLMQDNSAFRAKCDDSNHHMGGMRMAEQAEDGIVDADLRVFGTRNVYVCSAAVFPTSSFSNPTHTVLALAVRLADHLGNELSGELG